MEDAAVGELQKGRGQFESIDTPSKPTHTHTHTHTFTLTECLIHIIGGGKKHLGMTCRLLVNLVLGHVT